MDDITAMDRRALMRTLGLLLGAASLPTLAGCKAALKGDGALDEAQLKLLSAIADTIIPATDTPGAVGANVQGLERHDPRLGVGRDACRADQGH